MEAERSLIQETPERVGSSYFHDHVRIELIPFEGTLQPQPGGLLRPDRSRVGLGLEIKHADLEQYRVG